MDEKQVLQFWEVNKICLLPAILYLKAHENVRKHVD